MTVNIALIILGGVIPIIYYFSAHYFARRNGTQKYLHEHFPTRVADWLFIPFNVGVIMSTTLPHFDYLVVLLICIIPTVMINNVWKKNFKGKPNVFFKKNKLHSVGWTHTIFFLIELPLVCLFLTLPSQNNWYILGIVSLLTYLILCIKNQRTDPMLKGHKKPEIPLHAACILFLLIRAVLALLGIY